MTNPNLNGSNGNNRLIDPEKLLDMAMDDVDFLSELIDLFTALIPEQIQEIKQAMAQNDAETLAVVAHSFKGAVGNYTQGAPHLLLQDLENAGKSGQLQDCPEKLELLEQELTNLKTELASFRSTTCHSV